MRTCYLSLLPRRSVVSGSCWIVWCSIRARRPALLVMAVLTLRSCSKSSSSLYHCGPRKRSNIFLMVWLVTCPVSTSSYVTPWRPTYHSHPLQVHFCPPQLFPVVMLVAFPLGDPAEFSRQLKDVLHQRTPTNLIHGDLKTEQKRRRWDPHSLTRYIQELNVPWPLDLWNVLDTTPEASYSRFCFGGCTRHRKVWLLCGGGIQVDLRWIYHRTFVNQSTSSSHPSILVGYIEPKEVWLSYCRDTKRCDQKILHTLVRVDLCGVRRVYFTFA